MCKYTTIARTYLYTYTTKHLKIQHQIYLCGTSIVKTVVKAWHFSNPKKFFEKLLRVSCSDLLTVKQFAGRQPSPNGHP